MEFQNRPPAYHAGIQRSTISTRTKTARQAERSRFEDQTDCPAPSLTQSYKELVPKGIPGSTHSASSICEETSCAASISQSPVYEKVLSHFTPEVPVQLTPTGPAKRALIGPEGGSLEIYGNVLTFPEGAVSSPTTVDFGLVWDARFRPTPPTGYQMTAIVSCEPSGVVFQKPVLLTVPHCLVVSPDQKKMIQPVLLSSHHKEGEQPRWEESEIHPTNFTLKERTIDIKISNFCFVTVQLPDGTKVDAKKICIIPYSSAANYGQDLKIRVHIIDAVEATEEKVKQKESEVGGEQLAECNFLLLGNCGTLNVKIKWHNRGWSKQTCDIEIPFREMWAFDHHVKELYLENTAYCKSFRCEMQIYQEGNDSVMHMPFSKEIQIDLQKACLKEIESLSENQHHPCPDSKSLSGDLVSQVMLPTVPPPPYVPEDLLSWSFSDCRTPAKCDQVAGCASGTEAEIAPLNSLTMTGLPNQRCDTSDKRNQSVLPRICRAGSTYDTSTPIQSKFVGDNQIARPTNSLNLTLQPLEPDISSVGNENDQHRAHCNTQLSISDDLGNTERKNTAVSLNKQAFAVTQFFIGNVTVQGERKGLTFQANPSIIPMSLQKQLGSHLDSRTSVAASWIDLARHWDLEDYSRDIERKDISNQGFAFLTLAAEKQKFKSLAELREALDEIGRDDCVELVKEEEIRAGKRKHSSEASVEAMECDESPSPKSDKPGELVAVEPLTRAFFSQLSGGLPFCDDVFPTPLSSIEQLPASFNIRTTPGPNTQETRDGKVTCGTALVSNPATQARGSTKLLRNTSKDGMGCGASNQAPARDVLASHGLDRSENTTPDGQ
ncbi:uncharacterized protein [Diadema setosum]|uniref:uncharacterized protein n=1 Tax=Diadema setosum TaxID=31175 RepID=UPI003B3B5350